MEWISVKDRLPEFGAHIACLKNKSVIELNFSPIPSPYWFKVGMGINVGKNNPVTHWMPLPEPPPKEGTND